MMIDSSDLNPALAENTNGTKLYHLAIAILILAAIASGLQWRRWMPFWQRDPYWLSTEAGVVYAIHGLAAIALVTMVIVHVYFALSR